MAATPKTLTVTGGIEIKCNWNALYADDINSTADSVSYQLKPTLSAGTGDNAIKEIYRARRTVSAATTTDLLDLYGGLTDPFGVTINFAKIREILIYNRSAVSGDKILLGGAASNAWSAPFNASATAKIVVPPSGWISWGAYVDGFAVVNASSDVLQVQWSGVSTSIDYDIVLKGTI